LSNTETNTGRKFKTFNRKYIKASREKKQMSQIAEITQATIVTPVVVTPDFPTQIRSEEDINAFAFASKDTEKAIAALDRRIQRFTEMKSILVSNREVAEKHLSNQFVTWIKAKAETGKRTWENAMMKLTLKASLGSLKPLNAASKKKCVEYLRDVQPSACTIIIQAEDDATWKKVMKKLEGMEKVSVTHDVKGISDTTKAKLFALTDEGIASHGFAAIRPCEDSLSVTIK
jgi:hypothetical protein